MKAPHMSNEQLQAANARLAAAETEQVALAAAIRRLEAQIIAARRSASPDERDALAGIQGRADSVASRFGERVPAPNLGETATGYLRRMLQGLQKHSPQFKDASFAAMDSATLGLVANQVYADADAAASAVVASRPGVLIARERQVGGRTITEFEGDNLAWMAPFMTGGQVGRVDRTFSKAGAASSAILDRSR